MTQHLKIFISSTFQDMQEEREILLKKTFLELKKIAKKRDVEITEIDLRTGITKEQEQSGQIIKICLDEIERCSDSPIFFLGMLGNRYGWDEWYSHTNEETLENPYYSWIKEHIGKSVTELEIISAIERGKSNNRAFFYLKEEKLDDDKKLIELKNRLIEKSRIDNNLYVARYKDGRDFQKKTIDSFTQALDKFYPKDKKLSELERLRAVHRVFAKSRQKIYIPHLRNEKILSEFIKNDQDRLLLYGESGYGKSALIANYFEQLKEEDSYFVITHYIGGAGEFSNDLYQMLRRVMLEIKVKFDLPDKLPIESQKIMDEFAVWLHKVESPTVIIFDGYNQIENEMKEKLFYYMPKKLENVKLILTSIKDDYPISNKYEIKALNQEEKKELIMSYLKEYGKELNSEIIQKILVHSKTNNTLFLRTLLNEIRLLGVFEEVGENIENYLEVKDVVGLFDKVFRRLENDYRPNLAREVLSLLYVSRDGLSESNLIEIINENSIDNLTRFEFSPLFLALEEHLIDRGGLYGFFHDYIYEAIQKRYFIIDKSLIETRLKIITYMNQLELDNQKVRELPYHLLKIKNKKFLYRVLLDIDFFILSHKMNQFELLMYIKYIDQDFYKELTFKILDYNISFSDMNNIALFLHWFCHKKKEALLLYKKCLFLRKKNLGINHLETAISYNNLGGFYRSNNQHEKAKLFYQKAFDIRNKLLGKGHADTAMSYYNLAGLYRTMGYYQKAKLLYVEAFKIRKKLLHRNHLELALSYNGLGMIFFVLGKVKKVKFFYKQALLIRKRVLGEIHPDIAISYNNIAAIERQLGNLEEATFLYKKSLEIKRTIWGERHLHTATGYNNLGNIYRVLEKYDDAQILLEKSLYIRKAIHGETHLSVSRSYNNLANLYRDIGKYLEAESYYFKSIEIKIKLLQPSHSSTARGYHNLGSLYLLMKEYDKSYHFLIRALDIRKSKFGENHLHVSLTYHKLALFFEETFNYKKAFYFIEKSYIIKRNFLNHTHLNIIQVKKDLNRIQNKIK